MRFQNILHPTDFSELSQTALRYAAEMAHDHGARLLILHAVETLGPENVTYGEATTQLQPEKAYRQRLWDDLHRVQSPRADVQVEYILSEADPAEAILRTAAERSCDLIVLASHDRPWLKRLLMGSVAEEVVRQAPCPVLVVKETKGRTPPPPEEGTSEIHPGQLRETEG